MPFHPGWSGPTEGLGYGGYYVGDGCYGHVGHQQGNRIPAQEIRTVQNAKPGHLIS
jgi:hypothetical protein